MLNNYGIDMNHTSDVYRYIKSHLHNKFINKDKNDEHLSEGLFFGNLFLKPFYVSYNRNERDILIKYLKNNGYSFSGGQKVDYSIALIFVDVKRKIACDSNMMEYFGNMGEYDIISSDKFLSGKYDTEEYKRKREKLKKLHSDVDPLGEEDWDMNEQFHDLDPYGEDDWHNYDFNNLTIDEIINLPFGEIEHYIKSLKTRNMRFHTLIILKDIMGSERWEDFINSGVSGLDMLRGY